MSLRYISSNLQLKNSLQEGLQQMPQYLTQKLEDNLDIFIRLFPKVMGHKKLTLLQKLVLSDVISFQINGMKYFKTSAKLAKELGYTKRTIQASFQFLNDNGYLDCKPFENEKGNGYDYDLRQATVIQIEKWVHTDVYLKSKDFNIKAIEKKDKNHPYKMAWRNRHSKKNGSQALKLEKDSTPTIVVHDLPINNVEPNPEQPFDVKVFLNPLRIKIAKRIAEQENKNPIDFVEFLYKSDKEILYQFFDYQDGVWYYTKADNKDSDHWENEFSIHYHYAGAGSRCYLKLYNEQGSVSDTINLDTQDLDSYYSSTMKTFKNLTLTDYANLKQYHKESL